MSTRGKHQKRPAGPPSPDGLPGKPDWVKRGTLVLAVVTAIQLQCEKADRGAHEHAADMANAFRLGRRVSIYESNLKWVDVLASRAASAESLRAHKDAIAEAKTRNMGGAEMAAAATVLGINLSADENLEDLERKAWGQVSDSFTESAQSAYRLGRILGRYDERSALLFVLFPSSKNTDTPELLDQVRRDEWLKDVTKLLDDLRIGHRPIAMEGGLWSRATDGRAILHGVSDYFAARAKHPGIQIEAASGRREWKFYAVVAHEPGYFGTGSVLQMWPDSLSSSAEASYALLLSAKADSDGYDQLWRDLGLPHAK